MVWALLVAVLLGTMTTSCERDNEVEALNNPYEANQSESEPTSPEEEDQFVKALSAIKGFGPKTAQRLIVDLKDKVLKIDLGTEASTMLFDEQPATADSEVKTEAVSALTMLGFAAAASSKAVDKILTQNPQATVEAVIRQALKLL